MGNIPSYPWGYTNVDGAWWATQIAIDDSTRAVLDGHLQPPPIEITHDPFEGFPNGRKKREMIATKAEMQSARLLLEERDYCAHKLIDYRNCRVQKFPFLPRCKHELHAYTDCQYEDYVLRLKEAEREKRLRARDERKIAETIVA